MVGNKDKDDGKTGNINLGDSKLLAWTEIPECHGYAIYLSEEDVLFYKGEFDHGEFKNNILDNLRRFNSSIRTLAGLSAKREFMEKKRTGIVIETNGNTSTSQIMELEGKVKEVSGKVKIPIYFCKGLAQEISLIDKGELTFKLKGLNIQKFLKKAPRLTPAVKPT